MYGVSKQKIHSFNILTNQLVTQINTCKVKRVSKAHVVQIFLDINNKFEKKNPNSTKSISEYAAVLCNITKKKALIFYMLDIYMLQTESFSEINKCSNIHNRYKHDDETTCIC